ncbi:putative expansin/pollen allergen, DPBB domain, expansin, cellulose-binding-like domain superfamily [Plasmopara halstedii]
MLRRLTFLTVFPLVSFAGSDEIFTGEGTSYTLGQVSSGNCNFMYDPGVGENYAALNNEQWESTHNCGRCAQVSCDDPRCSDTTSTEIVYLVDRCPECKAGDLDLSPTVFKKLTGSDPSRYKIKWSFAACPVQGNIKYCTKTGSSNAWLAIQPANFATGIASVKIANQDVTMVDSCYYYLLVKGSNVEMSAVNVELTSTTGETITEKVNLTVNACIDGMLNFGSSTQQEQVEQVSLPPAAPPTPPAAPSTPPAAAPAPYAAPAPDAAPASPAAAPTPPAATPMPPANPEMFNFDNSKGLDSKAGIVWPVDQSGTNSDLSTLRFGLDQKPLPETRPRFNLLDREKFNAGKVTTISDATQTDQSDTNYNAGEVIVPVDDKSDVSILKSDQSTVETAEQNDGDTPEQIYTKSAAKSSGTSPIIIALIVLAVVGVIALGAIVFAVKKKQLEDKRIDRDEAMIRAFDSFSSPVEINTTNIARI